MLSKIFGLHNEMTNKTRTLHCQTYNKFIKQLKFGNIMQGFHFN